MIRRRSAAVRLVRATVARLGAITVAIALLVGVLRSGKSYFFCPMMTAVFDAPCCGGDDHGDEEDNGVSEFRAPDCCQAKRIGSMPASALSTVPDVCPAPCVAVLPARDRADAFDVGASTVGYTQPARAGPPTANERRAELMVWLS